jgi:hypothetical protein
MCVTAMITGTVEHMNGHGVRSATNAEAVTVVGGSDKRLEFGERSGDLQGDGEGRPHRTTPLRGGGGKSRGRSDAAAPRAQLSGARPSVASP